jgi:precorrin-3B methylase
LPPGSLTVVGTGIALGAHLTPESRAAIDAADELLHLGTESIAEEWMAGLHPRSRSLHGFYRPGVDRREIYADMVEAMLAPARAGAKVCAAFYGHPGVYVAPSHEAVRRARAEGIPAWMLPAVSAEDCLFADLGVDPADAGWASHDATHFLMHRRSVDPSVALVLWQISVVGFLEAASEPRLEHLPVLVEHLTQWYPPDHEVVVYEASPYPIAQATIERVALRDLPRAPVPPLASLYVPPAVRPELDPEMLARLGLSAR